MCEACKLKAKLEKMKVKSEALKILMQSEMVRFEAQTKLGRMTESMGTAESCVAALRDLLACIAEQAQVVTEIEKWLDRNPPSSGSLSDMLAEALGGAIHSSDDKGQKH